MNEFNVGDLKAVQGLWFYWIFRANDLIRNMFYSYFSLCYLSLVFSTHAYTEYRQGCQGGEGKENSFTLGPCATSRRPCRQCPTALPISILVYNILWIKA